MINSHPEVHYILATAKASIQVPKCSKSLLIEN